MATEVTITGLDDYAKKVVDVAGDASLQFAGYVRKNLWQLSPFGIGTLRKSWKVTGPLIRAGVMSVQVSTELKYAEYQDERELYHMPQRGLNDSGQRSFAEFDNPSLLIRPRTQSVSSTKMNRYRRGYNIAMSLYYFEESSLGYIDKAQEEAGGRQELIRMIEEAIGGI